MLDNFLVLYVLFFVYPMITFHCEYVDLVTKVLVKALIKDKQGSFFPFCWNSFLSSDYAIILLMLEP